MLLRYKICFLERRAHAATALESRGNFINARSGERRPCTRLPFAGDLWGAVDELLARLGRLAQGIHRFLAADASVAGAAAVALSLGRWTSVCRRRVGCVAGRGRLLWWRLWRLSWRLLVRVEIDRGRGCVAIVYVVGDSVGSGVVISVRCRRRKRIKIKPQPLNHT